MFHGVSLHLSAVFKHLGSECTWVSNSTLEKYLNSFYFITAAWWLLKKSSLQISNRTWFHQLKVRYFDHLLQANTTAAAVCENPATLVRLPLPLVICRTDVTVKLPPGTRLKRVKALGKQDEVGEALTMTTPSALFVQISTPANTVSINTDSV